MQCERLIGLIKTWYRSVQDETMAPARMVMFMEQHMESCDVCLADPDVKAEVAKITELVLPESKIPKAARKDADEYDDEYEDEERDDEDSDESDDEDEENEDYDDFGDDEDDEL